MTGTAAILLSAALCLSLGTDLETLTDSTDRERLESAAVAIAVSGDAPAIGRLAQLLGTREFLARLDRLDNPQAELLHLAVVFQALRTHPSLAGERLCVTLAARPPFTRIPARLNYLLAALATVKPMSAPAAEVFRSTYPQGFLEGSAPLLLANASPRALDVFASMMGDRSLDVADRLYAIRASVPPRRTDASVLRCIARLLTGKLEPSVQIALLESVFAPDPQGSGKLRSPPAPPAWETASADARSAASALGQEGSRRGDLPATLHNAIADTLRRLSATPGP